MKNKKRFCIHQDTKPLIFVLSEKRKALEFWKFQGFVFEKMRISAWRTEERDERPSSRTTSIRKAKNPRATRTF
jgi:hypothetical protein